MNGRLTALKGRLLETGLMILIATIVALIYPAVFLWFITFVGNQDNPLASGTPFTLAQVMAIFGAFGLAGGFATYGTREFRRSLRLVATLYLTAALFFSLIGMLLPALVSSEDGTTSNYVLVGSILGAVILAGGTFTAGTFLWMSRIPELLREGEHTEGYSLYH